MASVNEVLLRRKRKVVVPQSAGKPAVTRNTLTQLQLEVAQYGYILTDEVIDAVSQLTRAGVADFKTLLCNDLAKMTGATVSHRTLFRTFPDEIPEDSLAHFIKRVNSFVIDLFGVTENAVTLGCGCTIDSTKWDMSKYGACPVCNFAVNDIDMLATPPRPALADVTPLKAITLGELDDLLPIARNFMASKTSISAADTEDLETIIEFFGDEALKGVTAIPFKETLANVLSFSLKRGIEVGLVASFVDTATDVLRFAVRLSNGDVSLAKVTRFRQFTRPERKFMLALLERKGRLMEDFMRFPERWIRLGERLHPGDYKNAVPKTLKAFSSLRDGEKFWGFSNKIEKVLADNDVVSALAILVSRPGEFARRLDAVLRRVDGVNATYRYVLDTFVQVVHELPTPLLLQLKKYYEIRGTEQPLKYIFPKGAIAKVKVLESNLKLIPDEVAAELVVMCRRALLYRFEQLSELGVVTLDESLKGYLIPSSQRSASKALKTITRGSRVPLPKTKVIRFFVHWKDAENEGGEDHYANFGRGGTDLDLSASIYGPEWEDKGALSYMQYSMSEYNSCHSGDVRLAPKGASEFIDIDVASMLAAGVRYVTMSVLSFSNTPFIQLPECFAGFMGRNDVGTGEIYDPRTVEHKFDISSDAQRCIPLVLDLQAGEMIWCDLASPGDTYGGYNVRNQSNLIVMMSQAMENLANVKPSLYDLFELHKEARESNSEELATVFSENEGITPTDIDVIMGEYLI